MQASNTRVAKFRAAYSGGNERCSDGLQARLGGGRYAPVEFFEPLAPPSQTDGTELNCESLSRHICKGEIDVPQGTQGGPHFSRSRVERDFPGPVERAFSDR